MLTLMNICLYLRYAFERVAINNLQSDDPDDDKKVNKMNYLSSFIGKMSTRDVLLLACSDAGWSIGTSLKYCFCV